MPVRNFAAGFLTALVLVGVAGLMARGEPIKRRWALWPAAPMRSLAGIRKIHVHVRPFPEQLRSTDLTAETTRQDWGEKLEGAGFEVVTQPARDVPVLELKIGAQSNEAGSIAASVSLLLHQDVQIKRLDQDLVVPTYPRVLLALETDETLRKSMKDALDHLVRSFIENCSRAESMKP